MKKLNTAFALTILITVILSLQSIVSNSQTFEWITSHAINYSYNPDMLKYAVATEDNGDIIYSGMDNFNLNYSGMYGDLFLRKYSAYGVELFVKQISGNGMVDHLVAKNGKYYLSGEFKDSLYFPGQSWIYSMAGNSEYFLAVFNQQGMAESVLNLSEKFPGLNNLGQFSVDDENMVYLGLGIGNGSKIVKMDDMGFVIQTVEQTNVWLINNIDFDPDGNLVVAGAFADTQCYFGGELFEVDTQDNMYVAKYNGLGQVQWVRFVEDVIYSSHNQIKCDHTGNIYFSGLLAGPIEFGGFQASGSDWVYDFFLTKLDADGEFQWLVEVPEDNNLGDASIGNLKFLDVDINDNVYVSGFIRGTIDWGNGIVSTGDNYYDLLLVSFSPDGTIRWSKNGGSENFVKSIALSTDSQGNCYMAAVGGNEMVFDSITHFQEGFAYPFLVKLNNDIFTGVRPIHNNLLTIDVYPNPANDHVFVELDKDALNDFELNLYTVQGQKLSSSHFRSGNKKIQLELPPVGGLLLLEIRFADGSTARKKIFVD